MATYPFVRSAVDLGRASGPRLGMAWHFAEGGGTVGYLSRPNPNGVSVHFVVEYTGRVVQMLALDHLHTSLRVTAIRASDDPAYDWAGEAVTCGATAAKAVLGEWWKNPNNATIGVEVEGFAKAGPNAAQRAGIASLWLDMADRFPEIRSLGHRDFADYKACPGKLFPWNHVGGHGPAGDDVTIPVSPNTAAGAYDVTLKVGDQLYDQAFKPLVTVSQAQTADGYFVTGTGYVSLDVVTGGTRQLVFVKAAAIAGRWAPKPAPEPVTVAADCSTEVAQAVTDTTNRDRRIRDAAIVKLQEM